MKKLLRDYALIQNREDFMAYKYELFKGHYDDFDHEGEPETYPCIVEPHIHHDIGDAWYYFLYKSDVEKMAKALGL